MANNGSKRPPARFSVVDTRRSPYAKRNVLTLAAATKGEVLSQWGEENQPTALSVEDRLFAVKALFVESTLFHSRNGSPALVEVLAARKASGPVPGDLRSITAAKLVRIVLDDIDRIHVMHPDNGPKLALSAVSALPLWTLDPPPL